MSDFGEHLANLAADGCDVSAPVPYRRARRLINKRLCIYVTDDKPADNPIDITPADRADIEREIINTTASGATRPD